MGVGVKLEIGESGQFDVLANGTVVASRERKLLTRLFGGGWPDDDAVVARLRALRDGEQGR